MRSHVFVLVLLSACGDNKPPLVATPQELPLLSLPDGPFNHDAEVTVAVHDGRVMVASINQRLLAADSFEEPPNKGYRKRVAICTSVDGGRTFGPAIDPINIGGDASYYNQTSDPVIRVAADGTFFLTAIRLGQSDSTTEGVVTRSTDGATWKQIYSPSLLDKPWIAVDDPNQQLYVAAYGGYWRLSFDGTVLQETPSDAQARYHVSDAYAVGGHARFATFGEPSGENPGEPRLPTIVDWDGTASLPTVVAELDAGPEADLATVAAWSHGPLPDGSWSVRTTRENGHGALVLRIQIADVVTEKVLTSADAKPFMPAATMDEFGRLHVVWYDSSEARGRLLYAHSIGAAPFADGFSDAVVVDDNATPGDGWWPVAGALDERRLREYIGIAIDDGVVYAAWTHAPQAPSRIWVTRISPPHP